MRCKGANGRKNALRIRTICGVRERGKGPCLKSLPGDGEDEGKQEISSDGMAHLRGESTENNDKYRITVDTEQVFYNVCDSTKEVKAGWGVVSVTMTGAHMDVSNVSTDRRWINTQAFNYNGKEVVFKAGEAVHHMHGKAILNSRDKHPELWDKMRKLNMEVYLQPAGFEDGVITKWKIEKQGKRFAVSIGVRDLFGGGLAESTKQAQMVINQLASSIAGKMGCALQITDTDIAMRLKNKSHTELADLRTELIKLAAAEGTRAIFRCGTYEVLRCLANAIEKLMSEMDQAGSMLKAGRRNGWLAIRPCLSTGKFIRCGDEEWAVGMPEGSHRMAKSWIEDRMTWLDASGMPQPLTEGDFDRNFEEEQTYLTTEGNVRELSTWRALLQNEELTQEQLDQMKAEPWFQVEVQEFQEHAGVREEYLQLIKTPKDLRRESGIDENLTTQRRKDHKSNQRGKHKRYRDAMKPARKEAMDTLRTMNADGVSKAAILRQIIPKLGSKAGKADMLKGVRDQSKQQKKDLIEYKLGKMALAAQKKKKVEEAPEEEAKDTKA